MLKRFRGIVAEMNAKGWKIDRLNAEAQADLERPLGVFDAQKAEAEIEQLLDEMVTLAYRALVTPLDVNLTQENVGNLLEHTYVAIAFASAKSEFRLNDVQRERLDRILQIVNAP